jgi:hypothetical protein
LRASGCKRHRARRRARLQPHKRKLALLARAKPCGVLLDPQPIPVRSLAVVRSCLVIISRFTPRITAPSSESEESARPPLGVRGGVPASLAGWADRQGRGRRGELKSRHALQGFALQGFVLQGFVWIARGRGRRGGRQNDTASLYAIKTALEGDRRLQRRMRYSAIHMRYSAIHMRYSAVCAVGASLAHSPVLGEHLGQRALRGPALGAGQRPAPATSRHKGRDLARQRPAVAAQAASAGAGALGAATAGAARLRGLFSGGGKETPASLRLSEPGRGF